MHKEDTTQSRSDIHDHIKYENITNNNHYMSVNAQCSYHSNSDHIYNVDQMNLQDVSREKQSDHDNIDNKDYGQQPSPQKPSIASILFKFCQHIGYVMIGFMGSKALGILREKIISMDFHKGIQDVNIFATKIPSIVRRSVVEGSVENALIPSLSQFNSDLKQSVWLANASMLISLFLFAISLFMMISVNVWQPLLFKTMYIKEFTSIFMFGMPCIPLYFISSAWIAILHRHEMFFHANIGQIIAQLSMMSTIWFCGIYWHGSHFALALATPAGALMHLLWQFYGVMKLNNHINNRPNDWIEHLIQFTLVLISITFIGSVLFNLVPSLATYEMTKTIFLRLLLSCLISFAMLVIYLFTKHLQNNIKHNTPVYGNFMITKINDLGVSQLVSFATAISFIMLVLVFFITSLDSVNSFISYGKLYVLFYMYLIQIIASSLIFAKYAANIKKLSFLFALDIIMIAGILNCICMFNINHIYMSHLVYIRYISIIAMITAIICEMYSIAQNSELLSNNKRFFVIIMNSMIGTSMSHFMHAISCSITSRIGVGTTSYINMADKVFAVVSGLSVAPSIVLLPKISTYIQNKEIDEASNIFRWSVIVASIISIPILFICMQRSIWICSLYLGGKTTMHDVSYIGRAFVIQLFSVPANTLIKASHNVYLASHKSDFIARSSLFQLVIDVILKCACLLCGFGMEYVVACSVLSAWLAALYLLFNMRKHTNISLV
jgi:peptidoglycan biosynthesis protein MviN/MurJ (putative lipid II flippase)